MLEKMLLSHALYEGSGYGGSSFDTGLYTYIP